MKIALIGYGKMGKMIEQIARDRGHEIVSIIDIDNQDDFNSAAFASADVAIEFTAPQAAYGNYLKAWEQGVKVVSGSTGWMRDHGDEVRRLCSDGGQTLFWASNFSIGVAIFSAVNRYLAGIMNQFPQYDVELEETHHVHKLDHPSGTAITLADEIVERIDRKEAWAEDTTDPKLLRVDNIRRELEAILPGGPKRQQMLDDYEEVHRRLGDSNAPDLAAELMMKLLKSE